MPQTITRSTVNRRHNSPSSGDTSSTDTFSNATSSACERSGTSDASARGRVSARGRGARALVGGARIAIAAAATLGILAIGVSAAGAKAPTRDVGVRYKVSYGMIPVGRLDANLALEPNAYSMSARFKSGGLAKFMKKTEGKASVSGAIGKAGPVPRAFKLGYRSGDKTRSRAVSFKGGTVAKATLEPNRKAPKGWVPTSPATLKNAIDPASAFLVSAPGGDPCAARLKVFDGRTRIDAAMKPAGKHRFRAEDFRGEAKRCAVAIKPVAGYKKKSEKSMRLEGVTASFVPVPGTNLHMLVELRVPTPIGKFTAKATRLKMGS